MRYHCTLSPPPPPPPPPLEMRDNAGQAHNNHAGQQWPTTTTAGRFWPKQANDSRQKLMQAHDSPRFGFSFCFIHTNEIVLPPGPTTTRPDPEGQRTQAHDCHCRLPQGLKNAVAAGV